MIQEVGLQKENPVKDTSLENAFQNIFKRGTNWNTYKEWSEMKNLKGEFKTERAEKEGWCFQKLRRKDHWPWTIELSGLHHF